MSCIWSARAFRIVSPISRTRVGGRSSIRICALRAESSYTAVTFILVQVGYNTIFVHGTIHTAAGGSLGDTGLGSIPSTSERDSQQHERFQVTDLSRPEVRAPHLKPVDI